MRLPFFGAATIADAGPLYRAVVAEARRPSWYREAGVPDTLDGRFAVLTSLLALTDLRLERGGNGARALAPRLTERFVTDMDVQMREAGFGDPGLGKQVRKMVGALAGRVDRWRRAVETTEPWEEVAHGALYGETPAAEGAAGPGAEATRDWWRRLQAADDSALIEGNIG